MFVRGCLRCISLGDGVGMCLQAKWLHKLRPRSCLQGTKPLAMQRWSFRSAYDSFDPLRLQGRCAVCIHSVLLHSQVLDTRRLGERRRMRENSCTLKCLTQKDYPKVFVRQLLLHCLQERQGLALESFTGNLLKSYLLLPLLSMSDACISHDTNNIDICMSGLLMRIGETEQSNSGLGKRLFASLADKGTG